MGAVLWLGYWVSIGRVEGKNGKKKDCVCVMAHSLVCPAPVFFRLPHSSPSRLAVAKAPIRCNAGTRRATRTQARNEYSQTGLETQAKTHTISFVSKTPEPRQCLVRKRERQGGNVWRKLVPLFAGSCRHRRLMPPGEQEEQLEWSGTAKLERVENPGCRCTRGEGTGREAPGGREGEESLSLRESGEAVVYEQQPKDPVGWVQVETDDPGPGRDGGIDQRG